MVTSQEIRRVWIFYFYFASSVRFVSMFFSTSDSEEKILTLRFSFIVGTFSIVFVSVDSEKTMTFLRDGTLTSNGSLCGIEFTSLVPSSGVYSLTDSTYTTADCGGSDTSYDFEQFENILIVSYPCIETCQSKFVKQ